MLEIIDDANMSGNNTIEMHDLQENHNEDVQLEFSFGSLAKNPVIEKPSHQAHQSPSQYPISSPFSLHLNMKLDHEIQLLKQKNNELLQKNEALQTTIQQLQKLVDTSLQDRPNVKDKNNFICFVCKNIFNSSKALNKHCISKKHICCRTCSKKEKQFTLFPNYNSLSIHLKTCHTPFE